jgi:HlyD family secretion protein
MNRMRRRALMTAAVVPALWAAFAVGCFGRGAARGALTASGTVEATEARLGFQAPGRIDTIAVREGDAVRAGQELARLDRAELLARRGQAEAQVEAARALLLELRRGFRAEEVAQARAARDAARQRLQDAERDLERSTRLYEGGAVSREALDKAAVARQIAADQLAQADEQLKLLHAGPRPEQIQAQRAQLVQAEAGVRAIDAQLAHMVVRAPFDAVVTVRHHEPGETVGAGTPVLTLMNPADRWVRIYIREDRIGTVRLGAPAAITTDSYPEKEYPGEVMFIAPEAEFTPKNVQTAGERVKLVYAVKVRVTGDPAQDLKPGMPADVRVILGST